MPFRYNKLKGRIIERYGTQGEFAKALKTSENTVSRKLNMNVQFSTDDIILWTSLLGIKRDEIGEYFFS